MTGQEPDRVLLGLARALREAGLPVTPDRSRSFLAAVAVLDLGDRERTRAAGRATLCGHPDELALFDRVFDAWFAGEASRPSADQDAAAATRTRQVVTLSQADAGDDDPGDSGAEDGSDGDDDEGTDAGLGVAGSDAEVLRHRDVALLDPDERRRLAHLFDALEPGAPLRRSARQRGWHRGRVDVPRTVRRAMRQGGETGRLLHRRALRRPRRVVLLVDVSGSMAPYADALLRLSHRFVQGLGAGVEVFTVGTRVTRITRALRHHDPEEALAAAGRTVPDWAGGTRLGDALGFFLDRWGRAGLARGAVVVVLSDGWERGDPRPLGEQAARLGRVAHRTVWVNPHRGKPGYLPVQGGVVAVLPHVDEFLAGHTMATYADLVEVVRSA